MEDKIERLFEAIKPTNSHFSELVITELVDDIIRNDPQKAPLLLRDINHKLDEFLCTELNSAIQEYQSRVTHLNKMKDLCFLRMCMELRNYEYDYLFENWKGSWIPYIDNTYGLLQPLEPFSNDEWGLYWFIRQNKKYIPFIPFNHFDNYFELRWEIFKQSSPLFEALDTYNKLKEKLHRKASYGVCIGFYGNASLHGHDIMSDHLGKRVRMIIPESKIKENEKSYLDKYIKVKNRELLKRKLHGLIKDKHGRKSILPIYTAVQMKFMEKPSFNDFTNEFGSRVSKSEYSKAFCEVGFFNKNDIYNTTLLLSGVDPKRRSK